MKGAVYVGDAKSLSLEQLKPNPPGSRDVIVEVGASGVCHSDLSIMRGYVPVPPGMVLGHEGAGRVVEVGGEVSRVQKGDRVIASFVPACGACWYCLREQTELCEREADISMALRGSRPDGSPYFCMTGLGTFAETMTVDESSVVKVDTDLPDAQLALIGCGVTTGVGAALNTAKVRPGSSVAVLGCGGVGQAVIQGARIAGAGRIIAIDPQELKRKTATKLGATDVIDPSKGDPVDQVKALTGGRGADYAFEVIGLPETILTTYNLARRGGEVIIVGMARFEAQFTLPAFGIFFEEKTIRGCKYGSAQVRRDFPRFVDLIETGRLDTSAMVSKTIKLDGVNDAFRAMEAGEVIRSVIA
ncbi:MAG TPA: Zn-dependent alcohol dehydrogenase [Candidatus Binatus sp.]|jgi:S-(hydroxymethyl)glutathione dehydrogenase / alcohol dehydrogenase|nr:Zn-dependent alcohol dehydrogenase [Candidatus Binatus sp.]